MAAPSEADERWIVRDHGEGGRNVNSWHWEEKQRMPWCKERLGALLLVAASGGGGGGGGGSSSNTDPAPRITRVSSVEGEATTTTRKGGKRFAVYDLRVTCAWSVGGGEGAKGAAAGDDGGDDAKEEEDEAAASPGDEDGKTTKQQKKKKQDNKPPPRTGTVVIEELASTHEPDDYVLTFKADGSSAEDAAARDAAERRLKGPLLEAIAVFCAEIAEL